MGQKTGAFETVVSRDPEVFRPESLRQFDAVFFNNTVGNLFTDPALAAEPGGIRLWRRRADGSAWDIRRVHPMAGRGRGLAGVWADARRAGRESPREQRAGLHQARRPGASPEPAFRRAGLRLPGRVLSPAGALLAQARARALEHRQRQDRLQAGPPVRPSPSAPTTTTPSPGCGNYGRGRTFLLHHRAQSVCVPRPEAAAVLPGGGAIRPGRFPGADDSERPPDPGHSRPGAAWLAAGRSRPIRSTSSRSSRRSRRPPRWACRTWAA